MSSPLPSICFFSPCDHICICFRAETIEIYGVETLERSAAPPPLFLSAFCLNIDKVCNHILLFTVSIGS